MSVYSFVFSGYFQAPDDPEIGNVGATMTISVEAANPAEGAAKLEAALSASPDLTSTTLFYQL
jgi:hypothetical protein